MGFALLRLSLRENLFVLLSTSTWLSTGLSKYGKLFESILLRAQDDTNLVTFEAFIQLINT